MCRHFDASCDPKRYFHGWYDLIGFDLARGDNFETIKARYAEPPWTDDPLLAQIADYLATHFTARSWSEQKAWPKD